MVYHTFGIFLNMLNFVHAGHICMKIKHTKTFCTCAQRQIPRGAYTCVQNFHASKYFCMRIFGMKCSRNTCTVAHYIITIIAEMFTIINFDKYKAYCSGTMPHMYSKQYHRIIHNSGGSELVCCNSLIPHTTSGRGSQTLNFIATFKENDVAADIHITCESEAQNFLPDPLASLLKRFQ